MTASTAPFAIAGPLDPGLDKVLAHWRDLLRGGAEMPFWDDLDLPAIRAAGCEIFLLDVFEKPERFRLSLAEVGLSAHDQDKVLGHFIDEVELPAPFALLRAQASATVEGAAPTLHVQAAGPGEADGYARLLLPAWGEGQIHMLLGAIARR